MASKKQTKNVSGNTNPIFAPAGGFPGATQQYDPTAYQQAQAAPESAPADQPAYGGGGGGGGAYDPTSDPTYQAYIANLDLQLAQQQSNTERQRAALLGQQDNSLQDSATAGNLSRDNISGNYESRGLFNSGGRLRDISQQQADQGVRESRIRQGTSTGISDLENALAQAQAHAQLLKQSASQGVYQ